MDDDALTKKEAEMERLTRLVDVHRGWCNYCRGNVEWCDRCPEGGCALRDYLRSLESVREEALEEAKMKCKAISEEGRKNRLLETSKDDVAYQQGIEQGAGSCAAALRALQAASESPAKEQPGEQNADAAAMVETLLDELEGIIGGYETAGTRERPQLDLERIEIRAKISALIEKLGQRWIPVSERLPDEALSHEGYVLV